MLKELFNLKLLLSQDGYTQEQIDKILEDEEKKYKHLVEKSLCRLYCFGEKGKSPLYLVPWCFDKIKQFRKERQVFEYWISAMENRHNTFKNDKMMAFVRWRDFKMKRNRELE